MTSADILKTSVLDLIFENRNKDYGAYALRKQYPQRLVMAIGLALSLAAFLLCIMIKNNRAGSSGFVRNDPDEVIVHTQVIPEQPKQPSPPKPAKPQQPAASVAQKTFTQIRITTDPIKADVPTQTDLIDAAIASKTSVGLPAGDLPVYSPNTGTTTSGVEPKAAPAPVDAAPEFPGGASAWTLFLSRNLQAPDALEQGEKKTVLVKFFVSEDGSVTHFDVVQSGGAVFDAEVIRVLKKMPKWKPALRNGRPTAVPFTQPVTFVNMGD